MTAEQMAKTTCPKCRGRGEFSASVLNGASRHEEIHPCVECGGYGWINRDWKLRGARIHDVRDGRDRSLREFAKDLGVPPPFLSIVERGLYDPAEIETRLAKEINK
jgi:hypothetical protein